MLFVCGGIAALASVVRYSDFLARLHISNRALMDKWSMGWDAGESSLKNVAVCMCFWRREYLDIPDEKLHVLGESVRRIQIAALLFIIGGMVMLTTNSILVK